jgi:hypothetical protein
VNLYELYLSWRKAWIEGDLASCRQIESTIAKNYSLRSLRRFLAWSEKWSFQNDEAVLVSLVWAENSTRQYRQARHA